MSTQYLNIHGNKFAGMPTRPPHRAARKIKGLQEKMAKSGQKRSV
jgi:hypothetical protein